MIIHLKVIGSLLIVLAFVHVVFPRYFKWREQLTALSLINQQLMAVHTFFIAFTVFLMGVLCLFSAQEIVSTQLGKTISLGLGIFWGVRFLVQQFVYSSKLWKGKRFETTIHVVFSFLWLYFTLIFIIIAL